MASHAVQEFLSLLRRKENDIAGHGALSQLALPRLDDRGAKGGCDRKVSFGCAVFSSINPPWNTIIPDAHKPENNKTDDDFSVFRISVFCQ